MTDYDEEGNLIKDASIFQDAVLSVGFEYLYEFIVEYYEDDDAEALSEFIDEMIDPVIPTFARIMPEVIQYLWDMVALYNCQSIALMLMDRVMIVGYRMDTEFDVSMFESYYVAFFNADISDLLVETLMTVYPGDHIDFFRGVTNHLYMATTDNISDRVFRMWKMFHYPEIYINNYFKSVYDVAARLHSINPDIFNLSARTFPFLYNVDQDPRDYLGMDSFWVISNLEDSYNISITDEYNKLSGLIDEWTNA